MFLISGMWNLYVFASSIYSEISFSKVSNIYDENKSSSTLITINIFSLTHVHSQQFPFNELQVLIENDCVWSMPNLVFVTF